VSKDVNISNTNMKCVVFDMSDKLNKM